MGISFFLLLFSFLIFCFLSIYLFIFLFSLFQKFTNIFKYLRTRGEKNKIVHLLNISVYLHLNCWIDIDPSTSESGNWKRIPRMYPCTWCLFFSPSLSVYVCVGDQILMPTREKKAIEHFQSKRIFRKNINCRRFYL